MRREPKSFKVEIKRRPGGATRKDRSFLPPAPVQPEPQPAAALFRTPAADSPPPAAGSPEGRILPCLVTEAAIDAAREEALAVDPFAPRPRGRPRKQRGPDDPAPLAPRKRGRPPKSATAKQALAKSPVRLAAPAEAAPAVIRTIALVASADGARSRSRRAGESDLPRGERWKRRLPKALR